MVYVVSDIHGNYKAYSALLKKINFCPEDVMYIIGDVLDRGAHPIKILLDIMERPNVELLAGNHCAMACECLPLLLDEITEKTLAKMKENKFELKLHDWLKNGGATTINEFLKYDDKTKREIVNYISNLELYKEIHVNGYTYILVHAGLGNFALTKRMFEYELDELVWERPDYTSKYFEDKYVISGHTPTLVIKNNPRPGFIYQANNHIAIDCGCTYPGGRLGCLRLNDMKEYYIERSDD